MPHATSSQGFAGRSTDGVCSYHWERETKVLMGRPLSRKISLGCLGQAMAGRPFSLISGLAVLESWHAYCDRMQPDNTQANKLLKLPSLVVSHRRGGYHSFGYFNTMMPRAYGGCSNKSMNSHSSDRICCGLLPSSYHSFSKRTGY